jgi:hypothetical protein
MELMELMETLAHLDQLELKVVKGNMESKENLVTKGLKDHLELQERRDRKDLMGQLDHEVLKEMLDLKELKVYQEIRVRKEIVVHLVNLVLVEPQVSQELLDNKDRKELRDREE